MDSKVKKPLHKKWWVWVLAILILAGIGNAISGEDEVKEEPIKVETFGPATEDEKPLSIEDKVKNIINDAIGEEAKKSDGKVRIINVRTVEDVVAGNDAKIIEVEMNADEHNTTARTRDEMLLYSAKLFPVLFKEDGISEIALAWNLPLEDAQGNGKDETVMKIRVRKDNDINWDKFDVYNFGQAADQYYEHKAIQVN